VKRLINSESLVGALFLVICLIFWNMSLSFKPEAAKYPQIIIILLGVTSIGVLFSGLISRNWEKIPFEWNKIIVILFLTSVYVSLFKFIDFRISTTLYMFLFMIVLRFSWSIWKKSILAISLTFLLYVTFGMLFQVQLP
jgi:hypothetical protein